MNQNISAGNENEHCFEVQEDVNTESVQIVSDKTLFSTESDK